jgi:hypothetical protein
LRGKPHPTALGLATKCDPTSFGINNRKDNTHIATEESTVQTFYVYNVVRNVIKKIILYKA